MNYHKVNTCVKPAHRSRNSTLTVFQKHSLCSLPITIPSHKDTDTFFHSL